MRREEAAKEEAEPEEDSWVVGRDRRTAIERLRVGGRAERVEGGWLRVMPPLGRTLMGLWASEAYSFHPVSTSRFLSILFHNTPRDVYVLQDARKMRSRLHSDIGRFTVRWRERMGSELKEENDAAQQSLRERSSWDLRGHPDYFSHWRSAVFYGPNDDDHALVYILYLRSRNLISVLHAIQSEIGRFVLTWKRKRNKLFENCLTLNIDYERLNVRSVRQYFNDIQ